MNPEEIASRILALAEADAPGLHILSNGQPPFARGRFLVLVHPGDITETGDDVDQNDLSEQCQWHIADLLNEWKGPVAILHRFSCLEFAERTGRALPELTQALWEQWAEGASLLAYGDDLEGFADLVRSVAAGCDEVFVTGAYISECRGCVNTVAAALRKSHGNVRIDPEGYYEP